MRQSKGPLPTAKLKTELQFNMQKFAPVYSNSDDLATGKVVIIDIIKKYKDVRIQDCSLIWDTNLIATMELENLLNLAVQVMVAAVNSFLSCLNCSNCVNCLSITGAQPHAYDVAQ